VWKIKNLAKREEATVGAGSVAETLRGML
jgi:hypothetical protein